MLVPLCRLYGYVWNRCTAELYWRKKFSSEGRKKRSDFVKIVSFKNGRPVLVSARKLDAIAIQNLTKVTLDKVSCSWSKLRNFLRCKIFRQILLIGSFCALRDQSEAAKQLCFLVFFRRNSRIFWSNFLYCENGSRILNSLGLFRNSARIYCLSRQFVEEKYSKVIKVCDLERDIIPFPKDDLSEIGQEE